MTRSGLERVLSGKDQFNEAAFAAGDEHGGDAWDDELADTDTDVTAAKA